MLEKQTILGNGNEGTPVVVMPAAPAYMNVLEQVPGVLALFKGRTLVPVPSILEHIDLTQILPNEVKMYPVHAVAKTDMFRELAGLDFPKETLAFLASKPDYALKLGYFKNELNEVNLPTKASYNKYKRDYMGQDARRLLKELSTYIKKEATTRGIILENKKIKDKLTMEEKIMKSSKKTINTLKNILIPSLCIDIDGTIFTTKDFLRLWIHGARIHKFARGGAINLKIDHPKDKIMSGDLMMHHMNKELTTIDQVREMGDKLFKEIWSRACAQYPKLKRTPLIIAVDCHKQHYYGDPNDDYVVESEPDKGTTHYFMFMTFAVVMPGLRYDLFVLPVHALDSLSGLMEIGLRKILDMGVRIKHVLADRAFSHVSCINVFEKLGLKYIMPIAKNDRIKNYILKSEGCKARFVQDYEIINKKKEKAITTLILVQDREGITRVFVSNVALAAPLAHLYLIWYSRRWGIETEYRVFEENFRLRTTSKNYLIRYFNFILGMSLLNLWQLVNLHVSFDVAGTKADEPILPADHFMLILNKFNDEYLEQGGGNKKISDYK
jgi:hypothetical protein